MGNCPICYNELNGSCCDKCGLKLSHDEMVKLKADTYDSIIKHLFEASLDSRRREQARCKIAMRNIKRWAEENKARLECQQPMSL